MKKNYQAIFVLLAALSCLILSCGTSNRLRYDVSIISRAKISIVKGLKVRCSHEIDFKRSSLHTECTRKNGTCINDSLSYNEFLKKDIQACLLKSERKVDFKSNDGCLMEIIVFSEGKAIDTLSYDNFIASDEKNQLKKTNVHAYRIFKGLTSCE